MSAPLRGLVLAGGEGSRLRSSGVVKPLLELGGQSLVARLVLQLGELGCAPIVCMVREEVAEAVQARLHGTGAAVSVYPCNTPSSLHTLDLGLERLPEGPVFCSMVDTLMAPSDWRLVHDAARNGLHAGADGILAVTPFVDDEAPVYAQCAPDGRVLRLGSEPGDPVRVTGGVYGFAPRARDAAREAVQRGDSKMRRFLAGAIDAGLDFRSAVVARILDVDRPEDFEMAKRWWQEQREEAAQ
jgi:choline kinase